MQEILDGFELNAGFDVNALAQELQVEPKVIETLAGYIKAGLEKTFMQNLDIMKKGFAAFEKRFSTQMRDQNQADIRADTAISMLESRLPMMKDPRFSITGRAVLKGFMDKGQTIETAVNNTEKYFKEMGGTISQQFPGISPNPRPGGRPGGFPAPDPSTTPAGPGTPSGAEDAEDYIFKLLGGE